MCKKNSLSGLSQNCPYTVKASLSVNTNKTQCFCCCCFFLKCLSNVLPWCLRESYSLQFYQSIFEVYCMVLSLLLRNVDVICLNCTFKNEPYSHSICPLHSSCLYILSQVIRRCNNQFKHFINPSYPEKTVHVLEKAPYLKYESQLIKPYGYY